MPEETIRVLVVEDNEEHAEMLSRMLLGSDGPVFEVTVCDTMAPCVPLSRHWTMQLFDIVLLDLFLPDCDGFESFLQRIHGRAPDLADHCAHRP